MTNTASLMGDESSAVAGTVALLPVETVEVVSEKFSKKTDHG
jgi:hypothetical protein